MPLQNRVTPFGELIATSHRGTLMGNRGCLHDDRQRIRRCHAGKRWIICVLQFKGRHRKVMTPRRYTELFFLDEATALAAGHRPCAECQRERYLLFRETWAAANLDRVASPTPSAEEMDAVMHAERLDSHGEKKTYTERLAHLPSGVIVADEENRPYLLLGKELAPWRPEGYGPRVAASGDRVMSVLTPGSVVRAIARGYSVGIHPSAE